ncbi:RNA polymerase factor sigma-70 [uncultured Clostridium sp.]|uniref:sigma-70 family RNA polymerase sigma factor n=1 Tax=uncultured Clostridium sp. TaxID=59620 RepID=UPI000820A760|nr:sigma-70 family RNA polymerase sigma factor [uncultured Clostridium sp.]SCJ32487.1 RNA polymerase factor sigma-70 [uncultured Clostridium sp.]
MKVQRLIKLLSYRDKEALEIFIDDYSTLILKVITYILNESYEKEYIEECYDDVIMIILDKCSGFEYKASFKTWVASIAKNKALDYKRKLKKYYSYDDIDEGYGSVESSEEKYFNNNKISVINEALSKLNDDEKRLFIKKYILNNSTVELCNEYKVNENVIYKRISRLKKRVRELINNEYVKESLYE